jgi:hypothetical protein
MSKKIIEQGGGIRCLGQKKSTPSQRGEHRLSGTGGKMCSQYGIEGITSFTQYFFRRQGRGFMTRSYDSFNRHFFLLSVFRDRSICFTH